MRSTDKIIDYLEKTYQPESIIVYGSFADGSANLNSDFDALIIAGKEKLHDSSFVDGVVLDVFVYPPDQFLSEYDPAEFAQVWDGKIILDKNGMGERLKKNVLDYIERISLSDLDASIPNIPTASSSLAIHISTYLHTSLITLLAFSLDQSLLL